MTPKQEMLAMAGRLDVLADAVTKCNWSEFTMRVPVEVDRDADIVMSNAAKCLREYAAARGDGVPNELKELSDEIEACWICASQGEGEITLETINNWSGRISVLTAALEAVLPHLQGVSVPAGYALVPIKPTIKMLQAGFSSGRQRECLGGNYPAAAWAAMLAAAIGDKS